MLRLQVEKVDVLSADPESIEVQFATHPQLPKSFIFDRLTAMETAMKLVEWVEQSSKAKP